MEIDAHDTRLGGEGVLGPGGVLDREAANQTGGLLQEVVTTVGNSEKIAVTGVPGHCGDILAARLLGGETPEGKHGTEGLRGWVVSLVTVVLVVAELLVLSVLDKHALHNLKRSLHRGGVEGVLLDDLNDLGLVLVLAAGLGLLLLFSALDVFEFLHVFIENVPLGGFLREGGSLWWVSLDTSLSHGEVEGLGSALLVEELITEGLLAGTFVLFIYWQS